MPVADEQVRIIMRERSKGRSQEQAAAKANVKSRQTVAKYEQLGEMPSGLKRPRTYRTREDPFAEDWAELEEMLEAAPELEAKALFEGTQRFVWANLQAGRSPAASQAGQSLKSSLIASHGSPG